MPRWLFAFTVLADIISLSSQVRGIMSVFDLAARIISPSDMRAVLRESTGYTKTRNRIGALTQDGLALYDQYVKAKPYLFYGSLVGVAASAWAFQTKGRKPDNREAMVLYGLSFLACAAVAWITRPGSAVPADAPAGTPPSGDSALVAWIDGRVEKHAATDPQFADKAIGRLVSMPGIQQSFREIHPLVQATVV